MTEGARRAAGPSPPRGHAPASWWRRWAPGLSHLRGYSAQWAANDVVAGLTLTAVMVPVGIAYAEASGVPGINGLYATMIPLLAYAVFGPSRIMVMGPDSSLAPLILAVLLTQAGGDPARAVLVGSMLALVSGLVCLLAGVFRLGFVTELLSKPIRIGYMNGIALTVLINQLPKLLGFRIAPGGALRELWRIATAVAEGRTNWITCSIGVGVLVVVLALRRAPRFPGVLLAITVATILVAVLSLAETAGVAVLGAVPRGLPAFHIPWATGVDLQAIVLGGITIALVSFADTSILSRTYAAKLRTEVDTNQEMTGLGAANLATAFFQGFPISSSSSRTPVAETAGARTQLTGVVSALAIGGLLMFAPGLLRELPIAALAAVVIASAIGLFEFRDLWRIRRIQYWEFWLSIGCTAAVALLGVIPGIGLAIGVAVIEFLWDGWRPHFAVLGRADGIRGYHDLERYPDARRVPGLVIFRWDAPLFFANAEQFHTRVLDAIEASPTPVKRVIVTAEPVTSVDVTSGDMLAALHRELSESGVELQFAEMKDPVKDKLKRFGLFERFGDSSFHPTLGAAVDAYLADHHVDWKP